MIGAADYERLSRIETQWSRLVAGHEAALDRRVLQEQILRYYGAVYRYLLGMLKNPNAAEDAAQDFAVRFLRGDFKGARRDYSQGRGGKGSFRSYLRMALRNLARDYWDQQKQRVRQAGTLPAEDYGPAVPDDTDAVFDESCRQDLLDRTYQALSRAEQETGHLYFTVLHLKVRQPKLNSQQMAEQLSQQLGRPLTAAGVRQTLHRARERFAELLLDELAGRLGTTDADELEHELAALGLLDCCRAALIRRRAA